MGRILGIDHGDRRIGIAVSDPLHLIASPKKTLLVKDKIEAVNLIIEIISEQEIEKIVIGLPFGMRGNETLQTQHVRDFGLLLEEKGYDVIYLDERLSSKSAKDALIKQNIKPSRQKHLVDQTAAALILQQYLDSQPK